MNDRLSGGGNDDNTAGSGENSTQETSWRQQVAIDSSGLPSDACLLAYLQAQGTAGMSGDPTTHQMLLGQDSSNVSDLRNAPTTHRFLSDTLISHSHAFEQQQVYGKSPFLGPQDVEQTYLNTLIHQHGIKRQVDAFTQSQGSTGFPPSDIWGSSGGGVTSSSSLNNKLMYEQAAMPATAWSSSITDVGASPRRLGSSSADHFQLYSTPPSLMTMKDNDTKPPDTTAEQFVLGNLVTGSSSTGAGSRLTPSHRKEGEQTCISTSHQGRSEKPGSSFEKASSIAGRFEPRWGSARPEEFQGQPPLPIAPMATKLINPQAVPFSSHQNDQASVATAPMSLLVDGTSSFSQPNFWDNLQLNPSTGEYAGGASSLPSRNRLANEAISVDLVQHFQTYQSTRMKEQVFGPRGMVPRTTSTSTTTGAENSDLARLPEHCEQLNAEGNFMEKWNSGNRNSKVSSTLTRSTTSTGIGAWSAASAELLDDLETLTREKTSRFKKRFTNKPKRPLSAYNIFFKEERERILREIPDDAATTTSPPTPSLQWSNSSRIRRGKRAPHGKIDFQSLAKAVGKRWQNLSEEAMALYKEKANDDLVRYKREMEEFMKTTAAGSLEEEERFADQRGEGEL